MKAEIIAVGSEMLTPDHIDTNSLYLTRLLNEAGCEVHLKTIVGDDRGDISAVLSDALKRSELIIFSGGLGPTEDDLTRNAVARVLNRALTIDAGLLEILKQRFAARGFKMTPNNERQAEVISGAEILNNAHGSAPGMWVQEQGRYIVLLPGPPRELKPMFEKLVLPRIREFGAGKKLIYRSFHAIGITESELDAQLAPIYKAYSSVQTTILASPEHIAIRLYQWIEAEDRPSDIEELAARIQTALGDAIFSVNDESLEDVVGRLLNESGHTLAVAESCTAGMLGERITRTPGSSKYFLGGVLCYSNEAKRDLCGVSWETLQKCGAVSAETAEALAFGVRHSLHSTIGVSITGIAGPGGGTAEKPVGLVYVGISGRTRTLSKHRNMPGDRESIRERSTYLALAWLRKFLMQNEG